MDPGEKAFVQLTVQDNVSARRQMEKQHHTGCFSGQGQQIAPRRERRKKRLSPGEQVPCPAAASPAGLQHRLVSRAEVLHCQLDAAPDIARAEAQGNVRLVLLAKAKRASSGNAVIRRYCSSLALTIYSPAVTWPNRYFPALLVLVVAIKRSWETPATVVTW